MDIGGKTIAGFIDAIYRTPRNEWKLTLESYYNLDLDAIRSWWRQTESRILTEYEEVIANRDVVMAGHLRGIAPEDSVDTVVAEVGMQYVTGGS